MGISKAFHTKYEPVIGLEVHLQLRTQSKIFCSCSTRFGDPPNSNTCPVCLGLPGALPVLNRESVAMAVKAALALNCEINASSRFARKNYFYPDLPKGYQISQFEEPLAEHGWAEIETPENGNKTTKRIGITRLHMEEDAGKSLHEGFNDSDRNSYIDLNRSGVPLIEIVSEPDLRNSQEAYDYLTTLKTTLKYLDVSSCNMEEGTLRCDANVSVRPLSTSKFGTKTEVKNLNSFRFLQKALDYEIDRQISMLKSGEVIVQETRLWDSREQRTYGMRSKEFAHDYRYFPEPDLLPLTVSESWQKEISSQMPELPRAKKKRFIEQYGLSEYDAGLLVSSRAQANYYENVVRANGLSKPAANWVLTELTYLLKQAHKEIKMNNSPVPAEDLGELISLIEKGAVSGNVGKDILAEMFKTGKRASKIIAAKGLKQISDTGKLTEVSERVIRENPKQSDQYRKGKTATLGWFVGQVMRATHGQANPQKVQEVLKKELEK